MNIRPVNSEEAYDMAIERIEMLWGAKSGTPDGDELDVLLTLVRVYEEANHPVPPPTPIEAINFVMDQKGMKQADLTPFIGSSSKVSEVLRGKRTLSLSMIRSLHANLGIPAEILIMDGKNFPPDGDDVNWDSFPVKEIIDRGWVSGFDYKTQAEEIMRELASYAHADSYFTDKNHVCMRQGRHNKKDNPYAIDSWMLGVLIEANKIDIKNKFNSSLVGQEFLSKVTYLSVFEDGPLKAIELLKNKGIKLVIVPHFKKTYLDGAVLLNNKGEPIIALSLRYDRLDNFWFTLMHELAHLVLGHVHDSEDQCIIDDLDMEAPDEKENDADKLARDSLIPHELWESHPAKTSKKIEDILDLASKADIHKSIVAGRIRRERNNYKILWPHVGKGLVRKIFDI